MQILSKMDDGFSKTKQKPCKDCRFYAWTMLRTRKNSGTVIMTWPCFPTEFRVLEELLGGLRGSGIQGEASATRWLTPSIVVIYIYISHKPNSSPSYVHQLCHLGRLKSRLGQGEGRLSQNEGIVGAVGIHAQILGPKSAGILPPRQTARLTDDVPESNHGSLGFSKFRTSCFGEPWSTPRRPRLQQGERVRWEITTSKRQEAFITITVSGTGRPTVLEASF